MVGRISSFQTLGTLDGPGVRFVIFMQGCPLRCVYCHNPETWDIKGGDEYSAQEVFEKIIKYKSYIKNGGVTVSGGEPLLQIDFITELFKLLKNVGIHTAIDTSGIGIGDNKKIEELFKYTDLAICDLKFTNKEDYIKYTGGKLVDVQKFLDLTLENNIPIYIRQVIVPGLNDSQESINRLKEIVSKYTNMIKLELLPFRKLCLEKYENMGIDFPLANIEETPNVLLI